MDTRARVRALPNGCDLRTVEPKWRRLIVVCGKCAKKQGDSRKAKATRASLKQGAREVGLGRTRMADVGCLGVCPKDGITACAFDPALGASRVSVLRPGFEAASVLRAWFSRSN